MHLFAETRMSGPFSRQLTRSRGAATQSVTLASAWILLERRERASLYGGVIPVHAGAGNHRVRLSPLRAAPWMDVRPQVHARRVSGGSCDRSYRFEVDFAACFPGSSILARKTVMIEEFLPRRGTFSRIGKKSFTCRALHTLSLCSSCVGRRSITLSNGAADARGR